MQNLYLPEGRITGTEENLLYTSSEAFLTEAQQKGLILEGTATKCDSEKNLYVELGGIRGIIRREEAAFNPGGEAIKDIAVITRVGRTVCFKVIGFDEAGTAILSRRAAQEECYAEKVSKLTEGDIIEATVTHMERFGAFCDIGCGLTALLPVDCISVSRISHPADRFKPFQQIRAQIKSTDRELCRITLTHKELLGTWEENASLFHAGETVSGIVRSVEPYGVFVELTPNLAGLAEWTDDLSPGQKAAVYIKSIIPEKNKVKLVIVDSGEFTTSPTPLTYYK